MSKKASGTKRDNRKSGTVQSLPAKPLGAERASAVKGGLKMLTSSRELTEKATNLASGVSQTQKP